jgi:hypothetical protein
LPLGAHHLTRANVMDFAEPVIGRRFAPTRWLSRASCCHRQWETDPPGTLNLTHRFRWFLHEGGADAEGGGADGIGGFEEARG